jgi:hypothetical protein
MVVIARPSLEYRQHAAQAPLAIYNYPKCRFADMKFLP